MDCETKYFDTSAGIYLRPITLTDTDNIVKWRNSPAVRKNFIYQAPFTQASHLHWMETKVATGEVVQYMICDTTTDAPLGSVYLRDIDPVHKKAEYGIFIGETYARGRGVGTAASLLMLQIAFEELHLHRIYLRVFADNAAAIKSYEKAGFVQEGCFHHDVCIDGVFRDMIFMAKINANEES